MVYRGARDGNSSTFKVGVVESVKDRTARVHWKYEPSYMWRKLNGQAERVSNVVGEMDSKGSPSIDSLVVLPDDALAYLEQARYLVLQWRDDGMPTSTLRTMLDNLESF